MVSTMAKIILSINAGSSSVKISVFSAEQNAAPHQLAEAQISGLTAPPPQIDYARGGEAIYKARVVDDRQISSQDDAFKVLLDTLIDDESLPEIKSKADIAIATHRIVHGGDYQTHKTITEDTYRHLEELNDLAPLHNTKSLEIVRSCVKILPDTVNVAHFDTQFHATIPPHIYTYPIDPLIAAKNRLRKYGFHGISYAFILRAAAEKLGKRPDETSIIALHLGSGASMCAIKNGKSWDTTMGLTPLAGLPGATRSGSVDPSLVFHYASDVGKLSPSSTKDLHISRAEEILNKESGWQALTGTTNFGIIASADDSDEKKKLAFDMFVDRVCGFVGSYYVSLGGKVDALVFSGGIGERSARLRKEVTTQAGCLGFEVDDEKNEKGPTNTVTDITKKGAGHKTLICLTDEQFEMARGCAEDPELW